MLSSIEPPALRKKAATDKLVEKIVKHDSWPIQPDILNSPLLRLTSKKPLWLDLQPVDIKSWWRHNWKSAQVVNSYLVCDHNTAAGFWPFLATVVSTEPFLHGTGTLWCLQKEMATYRHWSVSLRQDPDDVTHRRMLFYSDKTEWWLILTTLCRWRHGFLADHYGSWHAHEKKKICRVVDTSLSSIVAVDVAVIIRSHLLICHVVKCKSEHCMFCW